MAELRLTDIMDGVSLALHEAYPDAQIFGGHVKQGLNPGDFNVVMPSATHAKELGTRFRRNPLIDVIYYPKEDPFMAECWQVADDLTLLLNSITTPEGDIIHASNVSVMVDSDAQVLHVTLQYEHFILIPIDREQMEDLEIIQEG